MTSPSIGADISETWDPPIPVFTVAVRDAIRSYVFVVTPPSDDEYRAWRGRSDKYKYLAVPVWRGGEIQLPTPGHPSRIWVSDPGGAPPRFTDVVDAVIATATAQAEAAAKAAVVAAMAKKSGAQGG
ncbi:hypothetical protein [Nocardia miyunensis]|uniref:hypothetical protein n=1 Tax=Nocardia miyunensis TaxID=282684 RepID=UPI0012F48DD8|nr:hypothetical protein [Nocardia miyunensis]